MTTTPSSRISGSPSLTPRTVLQLKFIGSYIRSRANTLGRCSSNGQTALDDNVRPRTLSSPTTTNANEEAKKRKRSMRKQRYYGSVEFMVSTDASGHVKHTACYRVEPADSMKADVYQGDEQLPISPVMVEDPENETRWYFRYFLGREHQNFAGIDNQKTPYFLSVLLEDAVDGSRCRAILWQSIGTKKLTFSCNQAVSPKPLTAKSIVQKFPGMNDISHSIKEIMDPKLQKELLILEEQEGAVNFKFGVTYALNDQKTDDEMLSNANSTGNASVYTNYEGHEIMFHVSTMLPHSKGNKQQLERKRHIGNDIVNIIFEEGGDPTKPNFKPSSMKSQFTHIFAVVTFDQKTRCYRLWVYSEKTVPAYGPALPTPSEFYDECHFRDFLLTKLINGEKAAFRSRIFSEKRFRTSDTLIKDMYMDYLKKELNRIFVAYDADFTIGMGSIQKMTEAAVRYLRSPKNKEFDQYLVEFLRMGEHLKLTKSLSGEAPNILTNAGACRKQPWEPQLLCGDLPQHEILSSDSWTNRSLIFATETSGTLFINEGVCTTLFDPSCFVQQLNVLENFGILLIRCENGKESYISVFSLSNLRHCIRSAITLKKQDCLENRVSGTKGCSNFAVTTNQSFRLNVVVAFGKKLILLRWKLSQLTQLPESYGLASNFEIVKEMTIHDEPISICLFESGPQAVAKAAVLTKSELLLLDFTESKVSSIYKPLQPKMNNCNLVTSSDIDSEDILLTDHSTTLVFDLFDEDCLPLSISWTSNPHKIAYCFPFVIGFGSDTIEIRLAINGNLFASLYMPGVHLLAAKEDVFFATYDATWPLNDARYNRTGKTSVSTIGHQQPHKATCTLYKISVKNLLKGGRTDSAGAKHKPSPYTTGSFTPILSRFVFVPCSSNDIVAGSYFHGNTSPSNRRCTKDSLTSDSGCSRGTIYSTGTEDSIDLVDSNPCSPLGDMYADILL